MDVTGGGDAPRWAAWEWLALAATCAALLVYAAWPYLRAPALAPEGAEFLGFVAGARDAHYYLSLVHQDAGLSPFLHNAFAAPGPHDRELGAWFWWLLALMRRATDLGDVATYHLARYMGAIACAFAIVGLALLVGRTRGERWLATELAVWGSGFGALAVRFGWNGGRSADLTTPEIGTAYTALSFPHLAWALALLTGAGAAALMANDRHALRPWGWAAGAMALALGLFHPFNVLVLLGAWGVFALVLFLRGLPEFFRWLRTTWPLACGGLLPVVYYAVVLVVAPWGLPHSTIRRPPYLDLLLGFGLLGLMLPVFVALHARRRERTPAETWCAAWIVSALVFLHSYPLVRHEGRAILGLQVPLALLAAVAASRLARRLPAGARVALGAAFLLACVPTTAFVLRDRVDRLQRFPGRYYVLDGERRAAAALAPQVQPTDVVASSAWNGLLLSHELPARIFFGRWDVPDYAERERVVHALFAPGASPGARRALADRYGITVLWVAEAERGAYGEPGVDAAVRDLGREVLVARGGVVAVRIAPPLLGR